MLKFNLNYQLNLSPCLNEFTYILTNVYIYGIKVIDHPKGSNSND
jgi:hypothetical protein